MRLGAGVSSPTSTTTDLPLCEGKADQTHLDRDAANRRIRAQAKLVAKRLIKRHGLPMKVIAVDYVDIGTDFDQLIVIYFTAPHRVDFRTLVGELARSLQARIDLRQVGARDAARMINGLGSCGRELCCATFLTNLEPISLRMAKMQDLPPNPLRISGACGRLMCCLKYEHPLYTEFAREAPAIGSAVTTDEGEGVVVGHSVPSDSVLVTDVGLRRHHQLLPRLRLRVPHRVRGRRRSREGEARFPAPAIGAAVTAPRLTCRARRPRALSCRTVGPFPRHVRSGHVSRAEVSSGTGDPLVGQLAAQRLPVRPPDLSSLGRSRRLRAGARRRRHPAVGVAPQPSGRPVAPVPDDVKPEGFTDPPPGSGLERYLQQTLAWTACEEVAVRRQRRCRSTTPIPTVRPSPWPSAASAPPPNRAWGRCSSTRGPGGSGVEYVGFFETKGLERYDIVGWDPRGVGKSTPVTCFERRPAR